MVKYQDTALDHTFSALADPTRRALLAQLDRRERVSVSELARPFSMSLPAVMKHLDVLSDAGLITRSKVGRTVTCQLAAAPMEQAMHWLNHYQRFWSERLDRLAAFVEEDPCPPKPSVAIKPSLTLKRRLNAPPQKVYAAWTDPEKILKWFGPDSGPVNEAVTDVRVGGRYAVTFSTEDGEQHHVSGVYREVVPNQKLVFTWAWRTMPERESLVTVLIKPDGGRLDPDPDPRAVLRRARARPPSRGLDRLPRQARTFLGVTFKRGESTWHKRHARRHDEDRTERRSAMVARDLLLE